MAIGNAASVRPSCSMVMCRTVPSWISCSTRAARSLPGTVPVVVMIVPPELVRLGATWHLIRPLTTCTRLFPPSLSAHTGGALAWIRHEWRRPQHVAARWPHEVAHIGHKPPHDRFKVADHPHQPDRPWTTSYPPS